MIYLYTTNPDDGCHEIKGFDKVYGRPVQSAKVKFLLAKGWVASPNKLAVEEVEKKEAYDRDAIATELGISLYDDEGKKLHYKLIDSAIKEAQANEHNES